MSGQSILIALPKSVWAKLRPAADRRAMMPSRIALELVRKATEQGLVDAILEGRCRVDQPALRQGMKPADRASPDPLPEPAEKPAGRRRAAPTKVALPAPAPALPTARKPASPRNTGDLPRDYSEIPFDRRKSMTDDAIAHLKRRCILVDPIDRADAVRRYRVSGYRDPLLAAQVYELAIEQGFGGAVDG